MNVNRAAMAHGVEKRVLAAAWRALARKPLQRTAEFPVAGGPRTARAASLAMLCLFLLAGGAMLAGGQGGLGPVGMLALGGITLVMTSYLCALLIGSRRILRESGHAISLDLLALDMGLHGSAVLPMSALLRAHRADIVAVLAPDDVWLLSAFDVPNVLVELDGLVNIEAQRFGYPLTLRKRYVALYLNEPAQFLAAVANALPGKLRAVG